MASSAYYLAAFLYLTTIFHFVYSLELRLPRCMLKEPRLPRCMFNNFPCDKLYTFCNDLPTLHSFLHWTYDGAQSTISIAFVTRPAQPDGWVSWAINPTGSGMIGSQALIAFRDANGQMTIKTYNVSSHSPLKESKVWFEVKESSAVFSNGVIQIFATLLLPQKGLKSVNHVWQVGGSVTNGVPDKHELKPDNLNSTGVLDLLKGDAHGQDKVDLIIREGHIYGVLNVVAWGFLLPVAIIIARYRRDLVFLHGIIQFLAYFFGLMGACFSLASGIILKIIIFTLGALQVLSHFLIPNHNHKYWFYWKLYHHGCGYTILALSIIHVFKGFDVVQPNPMYRTVYIFLITFWVVIASFLEARTRRKESSVSINPYNASDIRYLFLS